MIGEIIAIGDELTSGRILNSNSYFAASQLFAAGHEIVSMSAIGDSSEAIGGALKKALAQADFVVVTGGLGATTDDKTNEAVAEALARPVTFYPEIYEKIKDTPQASDSKGLSLEKLAWLPSGAEILKPEAKMAGYLLYHEEKPVFFLPGVPYEMKELLVDCVIPHLEAMPDNHSRGVSQKVYKVFGLPETEVNSKLKDIENKDERIRIGYYPVFPEVHVSITVLGGSQEESDSLFQQYDAEIVRILGDCVFATDSETMEEIIGNHLTSRQKTLAVAESCSGGLISHKLTKRPGSSVFFVGGVVAYSNDLKQNILGVDSEILLKYGAVSAETVRAMADGVKRITKADYALSVTGIAGPTGGTGEKPVGTVYIGLAAEGGIEAYRYHFSGDRWQVQAMTSMAALDLLRRQMLGLQMKID